MTCPCTDLEIDFDWSRYWGIAAYYCYRAYGDQFLLQIAESIWNATSVYVMSEADANNGSHSERTVKIPSTCNNGAVYFGVFVIIVMD